MADWISRWLEWLGCKLGGHLYTVRSFGPNAEFECVYCRRRKRLKLPAEIFKD